MQTKSSKGTQRKEGWRYCQREERKLKSATDVMQLWKDLLVCAMNIICWIHISVCNMFND